MKSEMSAEISAKADNNKNTIEENRIQDASSNNESNASADTEGAPMISHETSDSNANNDAPTKSDVRYKLEVASKSGGPPLAFLKSDHSFDLTNVQRTALSSRADVVFEVITHVIASSSLPWEQFAGPSSPPFTPEDAAPFTPSPDQDALRRVDRFEDLHIHEVSGTRLVIHSGLILALLRNVNPAYSRRMLSGTIVTFYEPYKWCMQHLDAIKSLLEDDSCKDEDLPPATELGLEADSVLSKAKRQICLLLDFLQPTIQRILLPLQELLARSTPLVTFSTLWYLFRPGTLVYVHNRYDSWYAGIVQACSSKAPDENRQAPYYRIWFWLLTCDGENLGAFSGLEEIEQFEGQTEVTSLEIYPAEYWDRKDGGARRKSFIERGRRLYRVAHEGSRELAYDGYCYVRSEDLRFPPDEDLKKRRFRGRVIVDIESSRALGPEIATFGFATTPEDNKGKMFHKTFHKMSSRRNKQEIEMDPEVPPSAPFKTIRVKEIETSNLGEDDCVLIYPEVPGFALGEKNWMLFEAESLQNLEASDDSLTNLVLDPDDLMILNSLSRHQRHSPHVWDADFIPGKGAGRIVLLHGPPGVGKTYTVECIAAAFKRPLLSLTAGDIGAWHVDIERTLTKWLDLATAWSAIVLIDEADVFLEQRSTRDLSRNALVSVFLRTIEYFQGLLFLTTNRTGQIDDAFESRLHVVIQYKRLDDTKRVKIWSAFFDKLKKDKNGKVIVGSQARKFVLENETIKALQWNGREIRNAFQTAVGLAEFEASENPDHDAEEPIVVESAHFEKVCKMSKSFKDYMFRLKKADEQKRAHGRKDRHDYEGEFIS